MLLCLFIYRFSNICPESQNTYWPVIVNIKLLRTATMRRGGHNAPLHFTPHFPLQATKAFTRSLIVRILFAKCVFIIAATLCCSVGG